MIKAKKLLMLIALLFIALNFGSCGGGGSSSGGGTGGTATSQTPADLGYVIPQTDPANVTTLSTGEEISSELISVSFKAGVDKQTIENIISSTGGTNAGLIPKVAYYIKFSPPKTSSEILNIVNQLRQNPNVETASANYIYEIQESIPYPTDIDSLPSIIRSKDSKWGFLKIKMPEAWQAIRSSGKNLSQVIVAVIDTGIDLNHPDLNGNIMLDVNGKFAWDFGDNDSYVSYDPFELCASGDHGTKVSGIIASTINGSGINGVAPTAKIFPLKFWPSLWKAKSCQDAIKKTGGDAVARAVAWATEAKVDVINLSLGREIAPAAYMQTSEYIAIKRALENNIVVVASAGNESCEADSFFPAALASTLSGIIPVGATDASPENRAVWTQPSDKCINGAGSNFPTTQSLSNRWVAAPGTDIYTTDISTLLDYEFDSGTSFAAPFVSGLAALLKQINNQLTNTQISDIIRSTSDDITSISYPNDTQTYTWKRINAEKAVNAILTGGGQLIYEVTSNPSTGNDAAYSIARDSTYMYVVGWDSSPGDDQWRIEKRNLSDGALASGFGTGGVVTNNPSTGDDFTLGIAIDSTYMYVVGWDSSPGGRIEKRNLSDGQLITGFGTGGIVTSIGGALGIAIDSTYMYVGGAAIEKRSLTDGSLVTGFGTGGFVLGGGVARSIAIDSTYMYVVGEDSSPGNLQWRIEKRTK